ncbi:MAG TPA: Gfo/Idh/MocA family oxidoreductase [Polyangiaceae bacterium]|nr:Gfo/Idh/MocA family oxidoreductase [Polyangiaceae bacterium]
MSGLRDGMNWAPQAEKPTPVVKPGEFVFASAFFDHGHIFGQTNGLQEAGGQCKWAWDPDPVKLEKFVGTYPGVRAARSYDEILLDPEVQLITTAAVPCDRPQIGFTCMGAGKDYFTDKPPFTTFEQLQRARRWVRETGKKYMCDYSERLHTEAGWHAGELVRQGAIGRVLQVLILAPHNLGESGRPEWFFQKEKYGGILTDIGSHQIEQFLTYTGATDGRINFSRVDNFHNPKHPTFEDFGEVSFTMNNGASCYCRLDWFNPKGLRTWGDGRTFILGTEGYIEVRKYIDITTEPMESQVIYLVDQEGEKRIPCRGKIGHPFYGQLILDCLARTENAMTQEHCFKAAELSLLAQDAADRARRDAPRDSRMVESED